MPRPVRPNATRAALLPIRVSDDETQRALDKIKAQTNRTAHDPALSRQVITRDLVVGTNKINHGLGRPVRGYTLTPTVADATFAHALADAANTQRASSVWIAIVGVNQPGATIEVY